MGIKSQMGDKEKEEKKADSSGSDSEEGMMKMPDPMEQVPNMDDFFPPDDDEIFRSLDSSEGKMVLQQCCCCICNCQTRATEGMTCCCFVPIKCGVLTIGVFAFLITAVELSAQFFLILNDRVDWWFCFVNLILFGPMLYIATSFLVVWFGKDSVGSRGKLRCACILVIIAISVEAVWEVVYYVWIHQGDTVYYGWGTTEEGYVKFQKKYYLFRVLAWMVVVDCLFSYFICICGRYSNALRADRDEDNKKAFKKKRSRDQEAEEALDLKAQGKPPKKKKKKKKAKKEEAKDEEEKKE